MNQRALIERAGRGDHDAFGLLVTASVGRLEAIARLIVRDPELARDAVQDAYVRAWRNLPGLRDPDRFDAWLHRLTVNACLDVARRRRHRPIEVRLTIDHPTTIDRQIERVDDRDQLERAFRHLGADQRAVLVLHYYVGLSVPALAETLGIPLGTAQSRLGRALAGLRAWVESESDAESQRAPTGQMA